MPPVTPKETFASLAEETEFYKGLIYGDPGSGKTTALAAAARKGHIVYIDAEKGLKPKALKRQGVPVENIEPWRDTSFDGLMKLHQNLVMRLADSEKIYAVCMDTGTEMIRTLLHESVMKGVAKAERIGKERSEFDLFQEDYGVVTEQMRKVMRLFHGLDCHYFMACHVRRDTDDDGKIRKGPGLTPAVAADYRGYLDFIVHLRVEDIPGQEEGERIGLCRPQGVYEAKDRYGLTPKFLVNPTADRIIDYLDEKIDREKDPLQVAARQRRSKDAAKATDTVAKATTNTDGTKEEVKS